MLSKIKNFFQENIAVKPNEEFKDEPDNSDKVAIATCALLLEMAHTDEEFSEIEETEIESIMKTEFGLSQEKIEEIIQLSSEERRESLDLWQFTNLINENYSKQQKIQVIEMIWRVVYADGTVDKYEEYLVRKLSFLLNLDHKEMIDAKLRVKYRDQDE
jgi:uncharacterized tellurite resistance protein B-like protein